VNKVLLVEPKDDDNLIMSCILKSDEWTTCRVKSVAEALPMLDEKNLEFIVLDMELPNGHGRAIIERLKGVRDDVPIVVVTGTPIKDRPRPEFPVIAVLGKPINSMDLIMEVHAAVKTASAIKSLRRSTTVLREMAQRG
jgi:DNA-binding NtrC family response regulator